MTVLGILAAHADCAGVEEVFGRSFIEEFLFRTRVVNK